MSMSKGFSVLQQQTYCFKEHLVRQMLAVMITQTFCHDLAAALFNTLCRRLFE